MKGFKFVHLHHPIHKVKVKRFHYRLLLIMSSGAILWVHYKAPDFEAHSALLVNLLFAVDPTVE